MSESDHDNLVPAIVATVAAVDGVTCLYPPRAGVTAVGKAFASLRKDAPLVQISAGTEFVDVELDIAVSIDASAPTVLRSVADGARSVAQEEYPDQSIRVHATVSRISSPQEHGFSPFRSTPVM